METFIKKIFQNKNDEFVHSQFQKFSRGEFNDRAMIKIKRSKEKYTINTTSEYAKELVISIAALINDNKTFVTGALISALELEGFKYKEKNSAIGVKKYIIESEMTGKEIIELVKNQPKAFFALSFNYLENEIKIRVKSPKSSKSSSSAKSNEDKPKIDFIKVKTNEQKIIKDLLIEDFEPQFKQIEIKHNFIISDIIIPDSLKNEKDFAKVRELAERKGKIIRIANIDGKIERKETDFQA